MEKILRETISEIIIFHALMDNEIDLLIENMELKTFQTNEAICSEGDMGSELFVIINGKVAVTKTDEHGHELVITEMKEKDSFGEMTMIDIQKRSASVHALEETTVAILPYGAFLGIYKKSPETYTKIILNIAREFSRRLRHMDARLVEFLERSPEEMTAMWMKSGE